jgi:hypothetical protein
MEQLPEYFVETESVLAKIAETDMLVSNLHCVYKSALADGVNRDLALSLESICPEAIPKGLLVQSYTEAKSTTNLNVTLEGILVSIKEAIVNVLTYVYDAILKAIRAIIKFFSKETSGNGSQSPKAIATVVEAVEANTKSVKVGRFKVSVSTATYENKNHAMRYIENEYKHLTTNKQALRLFKETTDLMVLITSRMDSAIDNLSVYSEEEYSKDKFDKVFMEAYTGLRKPIEKLWNSAPIMDLYRTTTNYFYTVGLDKAIKLPPVSPKDTDVPNNRRMPHSLSIMERRRIMLAGMRDTATVNKVSVKEMFEMAEHGLDVESYPHAIADIVSLFESLEGRIEKSKNSLIKNRSKIVNRNPLVAEHRELIMESARYMVMFGRYQEVTITMMRIVQHEKRKILDNYNNSMVPA